MARPNSGGLVEASFPAPGVAVATLNLPNVRNAMTAELTQAWIATMETVLGRPRPARLAVTGAGPAFCSGADPSWLDQGSIEENTPDRLRDKMLPFRPGLGRTRPPKLVDPGDRSHQRPGRRRGAMPGPRLRPEVRRSARGDLQPAPFIELGTHGGMAASWLLPEPPAVRREHAETLGTGRAVPADEALEWGRVSGLEDDVLARVIEIAAGIAAAAPIAVRSLTKAGLAQAACWAASRPRCSGRRLPSR